MDSESIDKYANRLKLLAGTCGFQDIDSEVKSQVISGTKSQRLRRKGLSEPNWTLGQLIDCGRLYEASDSKARDIEKTVDGAGHCPRADENVCIGSFKQ